MKWWSASIVASTPVTITLATWAETTPRIGRVLSLRRKACFSTWNKLEESGVSALTTAPWGRESGVARTVLSSMTTEVAVLKARSTAVSCTYLAAAGFATVKTVAPGTDLVSAVNILPEPSRAATGPAPEPASVTLTMTEAVPSALARTEVASFGAVTSRTKGISTVCQLKFGDRRACTLKVYLPSGAVTKAAFLASHTLPSQPRSGSLSAALVRMPASLLSSMCCRSRSEPSSRTVLPLASTTENLSSWAERSSRVWAKMVSSIPSPLGEKKLAPTPRSMVIEP